MCAFSLRSRKQQAINEYNLGLAAKYAGEWDRSYAHNKRASELRDDDEATWWNLGIAATALKNWSEARAAWSKCGIEFAQEAGETRWEEDVHACVRLNPKHSAEVLWGYRLDPCRIRIMNIPLPESGRHYGDIILADGAQNGTRSRDGQDYPVFDELAAWSKSPYSTYEAQVLLPSLRTLEHLVSCIEREHCLVEDWSTVRNLCKACSEGQPSEHTCSANDSKIRRFGFAARSEADLEAALDAWLKVDQDAVVSSLDLRLASSVPSRLQRHRRNAT